MRTIVSLGALMLLLATAGRSEETLRTFAWNEARESGATTALDVRPADGRAAFEHVEVRGNGEPRTVTLLSIREPGIRSARYAVAGQVCYEDIAPAAFLEMWSELADGRRFFSRTLATDGPMRGLEGSSPCREFRLPFSNAPGAPSPRTLTINLVLPGRGWVAVGPLRLVASPDEAPSVSGAWWDGRTGGLVGGIAGALLGCLGGLLGILASLGKARRFVIGAFGAMLAGGIAALVLGILAVLRQQPYGVFYPLLLIGGLCSVLPIVLARVARQRYAEIELRRMRSMDAR